jgi:hypothetical protein
MQPRLDQRDQIQTSLVIPAQAGIQELKNEVERESPFEGAAIKLIERSLDTGKPSPA